MTQDNIDYIITDLKKGCDVADIASRLGLREDEVEIVKETQMYFNPILSAKDKMLADAHFELQELYKKIADKFLNN